MAFLSIIARDWLKYNVRPLDLRVIMDSKVNVTPLFNTEVTELGYDSNNKIKYKHYHSNTDKSIKFKIDVIIKEDDWYGSYEVVSGNRVNVYPFRKVTDILEEWITDFKPLSVVTDAIDIPNGEYVITNNESREQSYKGSTVWTLEFMTYNPLFVKEYVNNNSTILKALDKKGLVNKTGKYALNNMLSKCKVSNMKLGKKNDCCLHLNNKLTLLGFISRKNWNLLVKNKHKNIFRPVTTNALKNFQKKYKKTYNLKVTGKMDSKTLKALTKV